MYQLHLSKRDHAYKVLKTQQDMRIHKTIPKKYMPPKTLDVVDLNTTLITDYLSKCHDLFFEHLQAVITQNSITLELEEGRLREIVSFTDVHLAKLVLPSSDIARLHNQFITENNISTHVIHPSLRRHLSQSENVTPPIPNADPKTCPTQPK